MAEYALIVSEPFADFVKGDVIRDDVEAVLAANPGRVVRVLAGAVIFGSVVAPPAPPVASPDAPLSAPPAE